MAATPATSFSSENGCYRSAVKSRKLSLSTLPSPERSDCGAHTDSDTNEHEHEREQDAEFERAYQTIWRCFRGLPLQDVRPTFHLHHQNTYEGLHRRLAEHGGLLEYFEREIRKDWGATTGELTLRLMTSAVHEVFKEKIGQALQQELDRIAAAYPSLRPFRDKIYSAGHTQLPLGRPPRTRAPQFDRSPDGQLRYENARHPHFLFEIACSQDKKGLDAIVAEYFEATPEKLCTVLAFDIDYAYPEERRMAGHHHPASVALWTATPGDDEDYDVIDIQCLMETTIFRDKDARVSVGEVVLPFALLVPLEDRDTVPDTDAEVRLSFARLAEAISHAERIQRAAEASLSPEPHAPRPRKIRWLDRQGQVTRERVQAPSR